MDRKGFITVWFTGLFSLVFLLSATAQEEIPEQEDAPEEVVTFFKTFFTLYMDNYERIQRLEAMRAAEADQQAENVTESIQEETRETLSSLREQYRAANQKKVRRSIRKIMSTTLQIYPLYVQKIVDQWKPSDEQILQRRRMNQNQILRANPELATPSLLRRAFLGEIVSGAQTVPQAIGWLTDKIIRVEQWVSETYRELFPRYERLLSRVEQVMSNDDASDEQRNQVIADVRRNWEQFWGETDEGINWSSMRASVNRLSSLFRNRNNRLPGSQDQLKADISRLQKRMGDFRQLRMKNPFVKKSRRLRMMLRLSKSFVKRANNVGNGSDSRSISSVPMLFVSELMKRNPESYWKIKSEEKLNQKRQDLLNDINANISSLKQVNYKKRRETYKFPFESVLNITSRLGTGFGKRELQLAKNVRDITKFVRARYQLSKSGVELMITYQDALKKREFKKSKTYIQFDKQFKKKYQNQLRRSMGHVRLIRKLQPKLDEIVAEVMNAPTDELVSAYKTD